MPFAHLPLGQRIPSSPHAVSASLPTMRDIRGYEEKSTATMQHVTSAYPRFVVHPFTLQLAAQFARQDPALAEQKLWLTSSGAMADALTAALARDSGIPLVVRQTVRRFSRDGLHGVLHSAGSPQAFTAAKIFLQNLGGFLSSREAEDHLVRLSLVPTAGREAVFPGDAPAEIRRVLRTVLPACRSEDLLLTNSGMNAVYAAFRACNELQATRGRTVWLQLGWLYRDSIDILRKFTATPADYVYVRDALDMYTISRLFQQFGSRIAGVIAELPTNPLIQMPDIAALSRLTRAHGAHLIVDPSVASVFAVDVLKYADLVTASLTKYTASEGDVLAGLIAVNPAGRDAPALREHCASGLEPLYPRDAARLAAQIGETEAVVASINANAERVASFLQNHPKVRDVYWALHPASRDNFLRVARGPGATGGMISFTLRVPLEPVYDALRLPKGPSFGMKTTLICPFMYLAHYDLVSTPAGVAELGASRVDPELLRLCVGTEPVRDIIAALDEALQAQG